MNPHTLIRLLKKVDKAPARVIVDNVPACYKKKAAAHAKANPQPRALFLLG